LKKFVLLTKPGCQSCEAVRAYLKDKAADFEEWNVESKIIVDRLIQDPKFNQKFCNIDECYSNLPAIRLKDTGEYYFGKDLFSYKRFYALDKLLGL
jgi:glutaredoxin